MTNNQYILKIRKIETYLKEAAEHLDHTEVLRWGRQVLSNLDRLSQNKRVISPYIPILKRYKDIFCCPELSFLLTRLPIEGANKLEIIKLLTQYAHGVMPKEHCLSLINQVTPRNGRHCFICYDNFIKVEDVRTCVGKTCFGLCCKECLNRWLENNNSCPQCRMPSRVPMQNPEIYSAPARPWSRAEPMYSSGHWHNSGAIRDASEMGY